VVSAIIPTLHKQRKFLIYRNLTLFQTNPTILPTDSVIQGYHDKEEPGILSITFHWRSRNIFTGGIDRTIRFWKITLDSSKCLRGHHESVCSLECSEDFLLSGDESGEMILWKIDFEIGTAAIKVLLPRM